MSDFIHPHQHLITCRDRTALKGHQPAALWLTGLSASGKSTIAGQVERELVQHHRAHTYLLDGDNIRSGLNRDLGFSEAHRTENVRRIAQVTRLLVDAGLIVLTAFISPFRTDRDLVRSLLPDGTFFEIYVRCPLEVCAARDPKGYYQKARQGLIAEFTGITSPYEEPLNPELVLDTANTPVEDCVQAILDLLKRRSILP
ncbi:MAG TPA: adenylyl-sulfate kinase [Levilinea sp.]|nr:adenylyl-sulfate kinase [Levilinea sp.]